MGKSVIPILLATADVVQAAVCGWHGDWPRAMYWMCAAGITYSTTLIRSA